MTTPDDSWGPVPDADPLDELATAIVDGEATDEERARVATDPALAARVAEFRAVADLVATPVPAGGDDRREAAIAAALVAEDNVVALRPRRPTWPRSWLPAAAAVAVVVGGLGLLVAALGSSGGDDAAEQDTAAGDVATEATAFAEREGAEEAAAPPTSAAQLPTGGGSAGGAAADAATGSSAAPADLGDLPDAAALEALLRQNTASDEDGEAAGFAPAPCSDRFGTSIVRVVTARLAGQPVTVGVFEDRYTALDQATCEPVAGGTL